MSDQLYTDNNDNYNVGNFGTTPQPAPTITPPPAPLYTPETTHPLLDQSYPSTAPSYSTPVPSLPESVPAPAPLASPSSSIPVSENNVPTPAVDPSIPVSIKNQDDSIVNTTDATDRDISRKEIRKSYKSKVAQIFLRDIVIVIACAFVFTFILKTFLIQPFGVPSSSMENTLKPDDRILVSKVSLIGGIHRGDVVVFRDTKGWLNANNIGDNNKPSGALDSVMKFIGVMPEDDDEYLVKRVIGISGDHVSCKGAGAPIVINGYELDSEPYIKPGADHSDRVFDVTVPEGQLWVMGDNRPVSADSRYNANKPGKGFVEAKDVVGIVFMRLWPQNRFGWLEDERSVFADVPNP